MYKTKETAMKHLEDGESFQHKNFNYFRDSEEVAIFAIRKNYRAIEYTSERLKNSVEFNRLALVSNADVYLVQRSNASIMSDRQVQTLSAKCEKFMFFERGEGSLENDRDLALISVKAHGDTIFFLKEDFKNDKEIALAAVSQNRWALAYVGKDFKKDKEFVLVAIRNSQGSALRQASDELRNDKEFVLKAMSYHAEAFNGASKEIKELCKDKDPFETLTKAINYDNLKKRLAPTSVEQPKQKIKI